MAAPRLLDKRLITAEVAGQKKAQIDQGIAIAKKVDALRDTFSEEEKKLELLRVITTKKVQEEIDTLLQSREALKRDLVRIMEERKRAQEPLDALKQALDEREVTISSKEVSLLQRASGIEKEEHEADEREKQVALDEERVKHLKTSAELKLEKADSVLKDAIEDAGESRNTAQINLTESELIFKRAEQKLHEVQNYKELLERKEKNLDDRQSTIDIRERALRDRYNTLERTIKRFNT